jgi:hypothetical protein
VNSDQASKKELIAVKGTHDILPGEVEIWQKVEAAAAGLFERYGYRELRAPIIEHTELFEKGTGDTTDIVTKEMYTFVDKGGRSITLRPEYTPSVARAILEHRLDLLGTPMRYYYIGPMFRHDKPQKGRYRQFHQVDVEVFAEKDPAIDAEIIEMADTLLRSSKPKRWLIPWVARPAGRASPGNCVTTPKKSGTACAKTAGGKSRSTRSGSSTARSNRAGPWPRTFPKSRASSARNAGTISPASVGISI